MWSAPALGLGRDPFGKVTIPTVASAGRPPGSLLPCRPAVIVRRPLTPACDNDSKVQGAPGIGWNRNNFMFHIYGGSFVIFRKLKRNIQSVSTMAHPKKWLQWARLLFYYYCYVHLASIWYIISFWGQVFWEQMVGHLSLHQWGCYRVRAGCPWAWLEATPYTSGTSPWEQGLVASVTDGSDSFPVYHVERNRNDLAFPDYLVFIVLVWDHLGEGLMSLHSNMGIPNQ